MKSKVKLSTYCKVITSVVTIALMTGIIMMWGEGDKWILLCVITVGLIGSALFYSPRSLEAGDSVLKIHRILRTKEIPYTAIVSVDRCLPSAGGIRLCGSGGYMGYWGYFHDMMIGAYFGYYGAYDQCMLLRLRNGRQYVVSCVEPDLMASAIRSHLDA